MKATFIYLNGSTEEFDLDEDGISISVGEGSDIYFYIGGIEYRQGVEEIVIKDIRKETSTEVQAATSG